MEDFGKVHPVRQSLHEVSLKSRDYSGFLLGAMFAAVGLVPWVIPSLQICEQAPDACTYGTFSFVTAGCLIAFFGIGSFLTKLSPESNRYQTRHWRPYRTVAAEGALSDITGTLERSAGSSKSRRTQLGMLDVNAEYHPIALPGSPGSRRTRRTAHEICTLLGLDEATVLNGWDIKPSLSEAARSLRGVAVQAEEAAALRASLESNPTDIPAFRQLALRLMRLDRRGEAGAILRSAHRHFLDQGARNDANRIAGIIVTLGL